MSRLAGDMKGFVVLGVYRSIVKKQNKEKTLLWSDLFMSTLFNGVFSTLYTATEQNIN